MFVAVAPRSGFSSASRSKYQICSWYVVECVLCPPLLLLIHNTLQCKLIEYYEKCYFRPLPHTSYSPKQYIIISFEPKPTTNRIRPLTEKAFRRNRHAGRCRFLFRWLWSLPVSSDCFAYRLIVDHICFYRLVGIDCLTFFFFLCQFNYLIA